MNDGVRCMWMRGGTSKGGYCLAQDLPADTAARDAFLLSVMGTPDIRQIDGMGGADPLTSKVAVVRKSRRPGVGVDYLFFQVGTDRALVSDAQNCGNILAGVGPFAIERGIVTAVGDVTPVRIFMENTGQMATALVATPNGRVAYAGQARIDGVPGTHSPVEITFGDTAGSSCGALLPTGNARDAVLGLPVTMIDNGMPCVVIPAVDLRLAGDETPDALKADHNLRRRLEAVRLEVGPRMNLGDVAAKSVPKMTIVSPPPAGWRDHDPHVHSPPLPQDHRRSGRRESGQRLSDQGQCRRRCRPGAGGCAQDACDRASDRATVGRGDARGGADPVCRRAGDSAKTVRRPDLCKGRHGMKDLRIDPAPLKPKDEIGIALD